MHTSGITVDEAVAADFASAKQDPSLLYLQFRIASDRFVRTSSGPRTSSRDEDFVALQRALNPSEPSFLVAHPTPLTPSSSTSDLWLLLFFMPDSASVRERMIYSSSSSALRDGLGSSAFLPQTFNIRTPSACTAAEYADTTRQMTDADLMTNDEIAAKEAETSSHLAMAQARVSAMPGLPIKVDDASRDKIQRLKEAKGRSALLKLDGETEQLSVDDEGQWTFEEAATRLPANEPRYLLTNFPHQHAGQEQQAYSAHTSQQHTHTQHSHNFSFSPPAHPPSLWSPLLVCSVSAVFYYFCPELIKPKLKMFYSTAKSIVTRLCEVEFGMPITKSLEISDRQEMSTPHVLDAIHPQESVKKAFKKPTRPGRGNARLIGKEVAASGS